MGVRRRSEKEEKGMTGKLSLTGVMVVWLVYVAWMISYYSGTFSLFSH